MAGRLATIACGIALTGGCISVGDPTILLDLEGVAEKGPFVGGLVTIRVLDETLAPVDDVPAQGTIGSDGIWEVQEVELSGSWIRIEAQGAWFDETRGVPTDDLGRLHTYAPIVAFDASVNVMGHLASWRFEELVRGGGDPSDLLPQAVDDVLAALDLPDKAASMGWDVRLHDDTTEGEALLMLSAMVQQGRSAGQVQALLDELGQDLADGVVDEPALMAALEAGAFALDPDGVRANLMTYWASFDDDTEAPDFSDMLEDWKALRDPDADCVGSAQEAIDGTDPDVSDGGCGG